MVSVMERIALYEKKAKESTAIKYPVSTSVSGNDSASASASASASTLVSPSSSTLNSSVSTPDVNTITTTDGKSDKNMFETSTLDSALAKISNLQLDYQLDGGEFQLDSKFIVNSENNEFDNADFAKLDSDSNVTIVETLQNIKQQQKQQEEEEQEQKQKQKVKQVEQAKEQAHGQDQNQEQVQDKKPRKKSSIGSREGLSSRLRHRKEQQGKTMPSTNGNSSATDNNVEKSEIGTSLLSPSSSKESTPETNEIAAGIQTENRYTSNTEAQKSEPVLATKKSISGGGGGGLMAMKPSQIDRLTSLNTRMNSKYMHCNIRYVTIKLNVERPANFVQVETTTGDKGGNTGISKKENEEEKELDVNEQVDPGCPDASDDCGNEEEEEGKEEEEEEEKEEIGYVMYKRMWESEESVGMDGSVSQELVCKSDNPKIIDTFLIPADNGGNNESVHEEEGGVSELTNASRMDRVLEESTFNLDNDNSDMVNQRELDVLESYTMETSMEKQHEKNSNTPCKNFVKVRWGNIDIFNPNYKIKAEDTPCTENGDGDDTTRRPGSILVTTETKKKKMVMVSEGEEEGSSAGAESGGGINCFNAKRVGTNSDAKGSSSSSSSSSRHGGEDTNEESGIVLVKRFEYLNDTKKDLDD